MSVLLDPQKGDVYFSQKLRTTLRKYVENMMDSDHMPHDSLRSHFVKLLIEVHLMVAHAWVDTDPDVSLSIQDVINLINTTRIGANYLTYKRLTAPNFKEKMAIVEH